MKKGKEPLRTFGDLMQFYELKQQPSDPPKRAKPLEEPAAIAEPQVSPEPVSPPPQAELPATDGEAAKAPVAEQREEGAGKEE
jgi:hypothetical protein